MKGVIFTTLNAMVEEKFGLATWDQMLGMAGAEGIYTSADTYEDAELFALIGALSGISNIPLPDLIKSFGTYALPVFAKYNPVFFEGHKDVKSFLKTVHGIIHVEVKKLHPDALLPEFEYESLSDDKLVMIYRSERKLCSMAEGLIMGAAEYFGSPIEINHESCLLKGDDHCRLELQFQQAHNPIESRTQAAGV